VEEAPAMEMESDTEDEVEEPARPEEPTATAE
jgi:hypothetical protein